MNILETAKTKLGNEIQLIGNPVKNGVLVIGVFHGDEPQGKFLIEEYLKTKHFTQKEEPTSIKFSKIQYSKFALSKSKLLRKTMTNAEQLLWYFLRANRLYGLKFRRQQPMGNYIVDFVCMSHKLIIELDGSQHSDEKNIKHDQKRTQYLNSKGYTVLRFWDNEIFENIEGVIEKILESIFKDDKTSFPLSPPLPLEGGGSYDNSQQKDKTIYSFNNNQFDNSFYYNSNLDPHPLEEGGSCDNSQQKDKTIYSFNNNQYENLFYYNSNLDPLPPRGGGIGRGGNLLFIPCFNPDGMQLNKRTNANNVDLNRNFPTKNWGKNEGDNATCDDETTAYYGGKSPASELETQFVINIIEKYSPKCILTLHAPYKVVNYDGPAKVIAEKISKIIGYPAEGSIGYPTPGSFGTYCGVERNIPTITLELDEEIPVEKLVQPVFEIFDLFSV